MQGIIGKKIGMTQVFSPDAGRYIPITVIQAGTNVVHQVKTAASDGYSAVQLGFDIMSDKKVNKPLMGHFKKCNSVPTRVIKEFDLDSPEEKVSPGQKIGVEVLENVKFVNVVGLSKGRGFTGGIKRHNFQRGRETHGCKAHRIRGSSGANTTPGHVWKGLRMEGHYGNAQVTIRNLEVVALDKEAGLVLIKGAVPGPNKGIVFINKIVKK
ncbi:MAG TPA: 50S ribosomal protein L3 [Chitinivibrionales bacterium]|jgi:large subunit ribosomal protein L3|nr:50S ribosomal protein L3 [Chitinivibrionales bacterium]